MRWSVVLAALVAARAAQADDGRLLGDDTFAVHRGGELILDAGVIAGLPAALPSGIATGIAVGITRNCGCLLSYGARVSWARSDAQSRTWIATHDDLRVRAAGAIRHDAGRGMLALRLDVGTTVVHESRELAQGMRAGNPMASSAWRALPAADLEAVIALHVTGPWLAVVSGGPTLEYDVDHVRGGFTAQLGVAWQP